MKSFLLPTLFFGFASTFMSAQDEPPAQPATESKATAEPQKQELAPNQKAFLNLPEEKRKEFAKHLGEASRMFQAKRIFETLDELYKAEMIFADTPEIYNLRGSCYVEFRAFDKATVEFQKALTFSKENPSVEFNLAEVLFVEQKYAEAHDAFESLQKKLPENNISLGRLVEFKLMLCKIKIGKDAEAFALSEKYDYLDESPFYYFAQAAMAYHKGDLIKAEEWLAMSGRIFQDPNVLAPWQDTLVEFGYIKSFYGDDAAEAAVPEAGK